MRKVKTTAGINKYLWDWNEFKYLIYLLSEAKDFGEILNLFIDLHTIKEITEIIRRSIISSYIISGKTYEEIMELTGASSATISHIASKLKRKKQILSKKLIIIGDYDKFQREKFDKKDWFNNLMKRTLSRFSTPKQ